MTSAHVPTPRDRLATLQSLIPDDFCVFARLWDNRLDKSGVPKPVEEWLLAQLVDGSFADIIQAAFEADDQWSLILLMTRAIQMMHYMICAPRYVDKTTVEIFSILLRKDIQPPTADDIKASVAEHKSDWCLDGDETKPIRPFLYRHMNDTTSLPPGVPEDWATGCVGILNRHDSYHQGYVYAITKPPAGRRYVFSDLSDSIISGLQEFFGSPILQIPGIKYYFRQCSLNPVVLDHYVM